MNIVITNGNRYTSPSFTTLNINNVLYIIVLYRTPTRKVVMYICVYSLCNNGAILRIFIL